MQVSNTVSDQVRSAFDFSVDKFPLSGPPGMPTPWYGLFRSDTSEVVGNGSVSDRYTPHTTDDVLALTDAASEAFDDGISVKTHFRNGHYVEIAPNDSIRRSICKSSDADNVFPRMMIRAAYDGKAFNATMGYYRDLCDNLSMLKQVSGTSVSIRHTSGLRSRMDDLIFTFQSLRQSWNTLANVIESLESREVQLVDFLNQIYPQPADNETGRGVTIHKNRTEKIVRRVQSERFRSNRPAMGPGAVVSAWEAYNAIQGYTQHDASRKRTFNNRFDRVLLASQDAHVTKAESIVMSLIAA